MWGTSFEIIGNSLLNVWEKYRPKKQQRKTLEKYRTLENDPFQNWDATEENHSAAKKLTR